MAQIEAQLRALQDLTKTVLQQQADLQNQVTSMASAMTQMMATLGMKAPTQALPPNPIPRESPDRRVRARFNYRQEGDTLACGASRHAPRPTPSRRIALYGCCGPSISTHAQHACSGRARDREPRRGTRVPSSRAPAHHMPWHEIKPLRRCEMIGRLWR